MRYKFPLIVVGLLGIIWIIAPAPISDDSTRVRVFCTNGRVFIEFEERHNTWGTMWLDEDGRPVSCDKEAPFFEPRTKPTLTI